MWYKSPKWRVNDALGHANLPFCVQNVPVPHLLSSLAISHQVIAQLQMAHSVELRVLLVTKLVILPEQGKLAHKQLSVAAEMRPSICTLARVRPTSFDRL